MVDDDPVRDEPAHGDPTHGDRVLDEQVRYYRARAREYDATAYGDLAAAEGRIERIMGRLDPAGDVLEIACGTGMWTPALARRGRSVTALDAAPETTEIARRRVPGGKVDFVVADVFGWAAATRYDVVFFSAFLSHVPTHRLDEFWSLLRRLLRQDGRVLFVDEHAEQREKETYTSRPEMVERTLAGGERFEIVKNFLDPGAVTARLARLGWDSRIERDGSDWVVGEARPR